MKKHQMMRPMMQEYTQQEMPTQNTKPQNNQSSRPQSHYDQNNLQKPQPQEVSHNQTQSQTQSQQTYSNNLPKQRVDQTFSNQSSTTNNSYRENESNVEDHTNYNNFKLSQAHKTKDKDYKINPKVIPRPNHFDEIYRNPNKEPIYDTNEEVHPPHSSTFYIVNETQNSSCRLVRSSLTKIPCDQSVLTNSSLLFGMYFQPFAEFTENEKEIPKVETNEAIYRCRRCSSYINSKYEITYSKSNKPIAVCNLCACENELDSSKPSCKNEYFSSNVSSVPELSSPTVDFYAPQNMKHTTPFQPHYLFMIDISQVSVDLGLPAYVLNSISSNLDYIHNAPCSFISIATYDNKSIQFFCIDKNNEVKAYIVPDSESPFCPLPMKKLFLNVIEKKSEIEKVIEKINYYITEKFSSQNTKKSNIPGSITGAAIAAGVNALEENGGRIMIFTPNTCLNGYGSCKPKEETKLFNTKDEKNLYIPQHNLFAKLGETCLEKRIVVDQFIMANNQYDLATFSQISNLTGGAVKFYSTSSKDFSDLKYKFEKLHYDLGRILTRPNYYDVKFMLRYSIGIESFEILGAFNKKLGEGFQLASCDPDYSFAFNLRLNESLKNNGRYHFQLVCLYIDNFNERYLRTINYTVLATNDISKIYTSADVDCLTKISLMREIVLCHQTDATSVRENLNSKLVNSFLYYRTQCSKHTPVAQLILPASIKYYPLYLNSFIKKLILKKNKVGVSANQIINQMSKFMREPLYHTIKSLYPKFFRIDDIQLDQSSKFRESETEYIIYNVGMLNEKFNIITKPYIVPLSLDNIDFNCAYISDDGEYISLFIFNYIQPNFYQELFGVDTYEEAVNLNIESLDENNTSDLNVRILNIINQLRKDNYGSTQPIKIYFLDDRQYNKPELSNILIEDKNRDETHYVDYLCSMHEEIQKKMNS